MWVSPEGRVYSHTSLDLWRQCHRRWYHKYVLGHREPTTDNMAAGTWLCQEPIECWERDADTTEMFLQFIWPNFLAEFGGDDSYDSPLFTPDLPKKILAAYKASPVDGKVVAIEETYYLDLVGGGRYQSKPDLVVERCECVLDPNGVSVQPHHRTAWDIKLKTFGQRYKGDTAWLDAEGALSEFDDQGLSQLAATGADSFGQIQFWLGKKDGVLHGPFYVERTPSRILVDEWKGETAAYIREIESWLKTTHASWPKNPANCKAFGRACAHVEACNFGWQAKKLDLATQS